MFKQLFKDLMSVWVTRWTIYATISFIITRIIDWLFQSSAMDSMLNVYYIVFTIAFLYSGWQEHIKEAEDEKQLKAKKGKGKT